MKLLAETTGNFMLMDMGGRQDLPPFRPAVVTSTPFVQIRIAEGQIDVLGQVSDEATDEEFAKYWDESEDRELAIASFCEAYSVEPSEPKQAPARKVKARS